MGLEHWLPDDWAKHFGTGSTPQIARDRYPSKAALLDSLAAAQKRVLDRLAQLGEDGLRQPLPDERHRSLFPTVGHAVLHILTVHAALHIGQLTVWRRAIGLEPRSESFA